jgi:hypothetical protein
MSGWLPIEQPLAVYQRLSFLVFLYIHTLNIKSLALSTLVAISALGSAPAQARIDCDGFDGGILCYEAQSATITRVGAKFNDGTNFYVDITCTSGKWMIHGGEYEGFTQTEADKIGRVAAKTYCETNGSHFVGA